MHFLNLQKNGINPQIYKIFLASSLVVILVLSIALFYRGSEHSGVCKENYPYLTTHIDCDEYEERTQEITSLEEEINEYVSESVEEGDRVGVWIRDLSTKRFAGVNSQNQFYLASRLKVPLLVSYYKMAEVDPTVLDRRIVYSGAHDDGAKQLITTGQNLIKGESYTINDLLYRAIVYSDNSAALELTALLPNGYLERTLKALGLQIESPNGNGEIIITPRTYANIIRILYNSSYLSPYYSNEALKLLLQTSYKDGVVAGFPKGVEVAHKFGERFYQLSETEFIYQLHDCGIVYFNKGQNPVLFCIMTEGESIEHIQKYLQDISKLVTNRLSD